MYSIIIYDYKEDNQWFFTKNISSIEEARKLKNALEISFKMIDTNKRINIHILKDDCYIS